MHGQRMLFVSEEIWEEEEGVGGVLFLRWEISHGQRGFKWIKVVLLPWDEQTTLILWEMLFFRGDTRHKRVFSPPYSFPFTGYLIILLVTKMSFPLSCH